MNKLLPAAGIDQSCTSNVFVPLDEAQPTANTCGPHDDTDSEPPKFERAMLREPTRNGLETVRN